MLIPVRDIDGKTVGEVELRDEIFSAPIHEALMHQALIRQLANARLGTVNTKTRSDVRGGGRKPWRQKGTGRARQGSIRSPQWRKGGIVFGPHPRSYKKKMPRKMRRMALRSALSAKAAEEQIVVVQDLAADAPRTKWMEQVLANLGVDSSALVLLPEGSLPVELSVRNLPDVKTLRAQYLNIRDLFTYDYVVMPLSAVQAIEAFLG